MELWLSNCKFINFLFNINRVYNCQDKFKLLQTNSNRSVLTISNLNTIFRFKDHLLSILLFPSTSKNKNSLSIRQKPIFKFLTHQTSNRLLKINRKKTNQIIFSSSLLYLISIKTNISSSFQRPKLFVNFNHFNEICSYREEKKICSYTRL